MLFPNRAKKDHLFEKRDIEPFDSIIALALVGLVVGASLVVTPLRVSSFFGGSSFSSAVHSVETSLQLNQPLIWGESSIAVDPTNPDNIIINALYSGPIYSSNGGINWTFAPGTGGCIGDPWTTYDSHGNAYVSMWEGGPPPNNCAFGNHTAYAYLGKSLTHGASFSPLNPFVSNQTVWMFPDGTSTLENVTCTNRAGTSFDYGKIVADQSPTSPFRDNLYLIGGAVIYDPLAKGCNGELGFVRSTDGGATYDTHRVLQAFGGRNGIPAGGVFIENIATTPNGTIFFTWPESGRIGIAYSNDGGLAWGYGNITTGPECCGSTRIAVANDELLYVAFEKNLQYGTAYSRHIFLTNSIDGGATWSSPTRLDDVLQNDSVDHILPVIDVGSDGHVFVAWRDFRNTATKLSSTSNTADIYAYSSLVPGNIRVSSSTGECCDYPNNDYFGSAATRSTDIVSYSIDEDSDSTSFGAKSADESFVTLVSYKQQSVVIALLSNYWIWLAAGLAIGLTITIMIGRKRRRRMEATKTGSPRLTPEASAEKMSNPGMRMAERGGD